MLKLTPPMGWNSWNTFTNDINEKLIFDTADKMVESGLLDLGYEYLVIDDCWSERTRDENDRLVADKVKFPHGMKYVADYVHKKGLKFGMYSCSGNLTCQEFPGSFEYEFIDAKTFAEWEVDFLKYDYCYHSDIIAGEYLYRRMGTALANCGRDILFSACSWGIDNTEGWIKETGASMWRSTRDVHDNWESVKSIVKQQERMHPYYGIGAFKDMDMLIVGLHGNGHVGVEGCNNTQYKTHFSIWAMMGSPLMIGCDIRNMSEESKKIMSNKELIKINQDKACRQPVKLQLGMNNNDNLICYSRLLDDGDIAIGVFNLSEDAAWATLPLDQVALPHSTGKTLEMTELWTGDKIHVKNSTFRNKVDAYDTLIYRCKVVDEK